MSGFQSQVRGFKGRMCTIFVPKLTPDCRLMRRRRQVHARKLPVLGYITLLSRRAGGGRINDLRRVTKGLWLLTNAVQGSIAAFAMCDGMWSSCKAVCQFRNLPKCLVCRDRKKPEEPGESTPVRPADHKPSHGQILTNPSRRIGEKARS